MGNAGSQLTQTSSPIVALLLINRIPKMPLMSISSILKQSNSNLVIGYISEADTSELPKDSRISYLDLSAEALELGIANTDGKYQSFDKDSFFSLVQLKWKLLERLLLSNPEQNLIYSDLDVFWIRDASQLVEKSFDANPRLNLLIQNFTAEPSLPQLCMGFVAFRNSAQSLAIVRECSILHQKMLLSNPRIGDDDVITAYYKESGMSEGIYQLPQSSFPVGNLLNLFAKRSLFPGLIPTKPYIYHSNFVVGVERKIETAYLFFRNQGISLSNIGVVSGITLRLKISLRFLLFFLRKLLRP